MCFIVAATGMVVGYPQKPQYSYFANCNYTPSQYFNLSAQTIPGCSYLLVARELTPLPSLAASFKLPVGAMHKLQTTLWLTRKPPLGQCKGESQKR